MLAEDKGPIRDPSCSPPAPRWWCTTTRTAISPKPGQGDRAGRYGDRFGHGSGQARCVGRVPAPRANNASGGRTQRDFFILTGWRGPPSPACVVGRSLRMLPRIVANFRAPERRSPPHVENPPGRSRHRPYLEVLRPGSSPWRAEARCGARRTRQGRSPGIWV